ncbi:hypothetical protein BKA69DRAFT_1129276 [Paraphysoderma sedebokerense]|nr:hypothetical protein BKA69DRAFT_1129276 [Paraphysoderma sedebokerense]
MSCYLLIQLFMLIICVSTAQKLGTTPDGRLNITTTNGAIIETGTSPNKSTFDIMSAVNPVVARYVVSINAEKTAWVPHVINFDAKIIDTHNAVQTGSDTWKFRAPKKGIYQVSSQVQFEQANMLANSYVDLFIVKGVVTETDVCQYNALTSERIILSGRRHFQGEDIPRHMGSSLVYLNENEFITPYMTHAVTDRNLTFAVSCGQFNYIDIVQIA